MAQPAWKRPGSPIGKKGPRKANPKYKRRSREPWSSNELRELKQLAKGNMPTGEQGTARGYFPQTPNRSPYNRRTKKA